MRRTELHRLTVQHTRRLSTPHRRGPVRTDRADRADRANRADRADRADRAEPEIGIRFRVLGPVEVATQDGRWVSLPRRRERCLLAALLLDPGRVVPGHRLVELLWEEDPPQRARRLLYAHVARVRALLADARTSPLVSYGDGYLIRAVPEEIDADRFRRLVERAAAAAGPARRERLLREALRLWRGPALHNAAGGQIRDGLCADLEELRLHAEEEAAAAGLALGRHRELVGELARLSSAHPWRSRLVGLRMMALCHSGRTVEALDVFARHRAAAVELFGLDPEPALRHLHEVILRGGSVPTSDLRTY